jgi:hypothetical protein
VQESRRGDTTGGGETLVCGPTIDPFDPGFNKSTGAHRFDGSSSEARNDIVGCHGVVVGGGGGGRG